MGHVAENFERLSPKPALISMQAATKKTTISRVEQASIIRDNDAHIKRMAVRFAGFVDKQDLIQEGRIALLSAAETFNSSLGVPLFGYAHRFIVGAMLRLVNVERVQPSRPQSGETPATSGDSTPELDVESAEILSRLATVMLTLDESERQILRAFYFDNKGLRTIAAELGVSLGKAHCLFHNALATAAERVEASL